MGSSGTAVVGPRSGEGPGGRTTLVLSYLGLRRAVGVIGMALPFVLAVGGLLRDGTGLQRSISHYYYTGMRDVLVGSLCAMAVFLYSYRYDRPDAVAGLVAAVSAVGVALFPTTRGDRLVSAADPVGVVHLLCAAAFFLTLAWFCLGLFTRTYPDRPPTRRKRLRNVVYRVCGVTIVVGVALVAVTPLLPAEWVAAVHPVFWLESLAVEAFGVAWLVKGRTLLTDGADGTSRAPAAGLDRRASG
jgi:hypothetical protein